MIPRTIRQPGHARSGWPRHGPAGEDGAVAIMTALLLIVLFAVGMLAMNWGIASAARASVRRAADAGVLAGCLDLPDATRARAAAELYSTSAGGKNAFTNVQNLESGNGDQVADPPPAITNSGTLSEATGAPLVNDQIRVDVRRTQWLAGVAGWAPFSKVMNVNAAAICRRDEGSLPVLHALAQGPRAFRLDGANLDLPRGGIVVNSTDPNGLDALGNAIVDAKYIETGSGTAGTTGSSSIDPDPTLGTRPDPYAGVPQPPIPSPGDVEAHQSMSGCTYPNPGHPTARQPRTCQVGGGSISPGIYYGGINFTGNATMQPGIYHMVSGGFSLQPGVTVTGTGILIFNDSNPFGQNNPLRQCGDVLVQSGASLLITPYGGGYKEVMIFQRRTPDPRMAAPWPGCDNDVWIQGGVTIGYADGPYGAVYTPNSRSLFGPQGHGSSSLLAELNIIVVADRIDLTGPITFADIFIPSGDVRHGDIHLVE